MLLRYVHVGAYKDLVDHVVLERPVEEPLVPLAVPEGEGVR